MSSARNHQKRSHRSYRVTKSTEAPKSRVPWLASQTDMLAEDWVIVGEAVAE